MACRGGVLCTMTRHGGVLCTHTHAGLIYDKRVFLRVKLRTKEKKRERNSTQSSINLLYYKVPEFDMGLF